jgi:hypothetical protein
MWRLLLPGHSPRAAYRLGLIKDSEGLGYDGTLAVCRVGARARAHDNRPGFSLAIRASR